MIRVTVDLISARGPAHNKRLGVMEICNDGSQSDGTGDAARGCYNGRIYRKGGRQVIRRGRVEGFPRRSYPVWRLILRVLRDCYPEEIGPEYKAARLMFKKETTFKETP